MADEPAGDITALLNQVKAGVPGAADRLMNLIYDRLKLIARNRVSAHGVGDLEPTTLVHEAYLKLFRDDAPSWENRHHFFWAAARAMRDLLVERARRRLAAKRGGRVRHVALPDDLPADSDPSQLLELDDAIRRLEQVDPGVARVVMLRYFAGLSRDQVAEMTGRSPAAVWRDWSFAKAWLLAKLTEADSTDTSGN